MARNQNEKLRLTAQQSFLDLNDPANKAKKKDSAYMSIPGKNINSRFSSSQTDNFANKSSISDENRGLTNEGRWGRSEHYNFLKALKEHGRDWKRVATQV